MNAFDCYKEYLSLKNHFTKPSYDYFKYQGKVRANVKSFESRNDKMFFAKLAKHPDPKNLLLSNFIVDEKLWVKDIAYSETANKIYTDWQKRQQSLLYIFKQELSKLNPDFDSNFKNQDHTHPFVLKLFLRNEISIETLIILTDLTKCLRYWSMQYEYDPVITEIILKIGKYRPFFKYDNEKAKNIVLESFSSE